MANMNATMNGSIEKCSSLINPTARKIGETVAYCLIFVVALIGNSVIALIVYKTQSMRKPINFFIVNMAMSDLLFPLLLIPRNLTGLYANTWLISGPLSHGLCKVVPFVVNVSTVVSIQSLVLIAVDRFGAVVYPLRSPLISSKLCLFLIPATWIVAIAVDWPYLFAHKRVKYQGQQYCEIQFSEVSFVKNYRAIHDIFYYIPITLLILLYSMILIKLKSQKIPGEQSVNSDEQRARRNRNVLKMAIAIVLGFILCWVPYSIFSLLSFFSPDRLRPHCWFVLYWDIAVLMACANCAMNPCICFIFSGNYRGGLKKLLKCFG